MPGVVIPCEAEFAGMVEVADPEQLFFDGAKDPFDAAVPLRLTDKGRGEFAVGEADLGLKVVAYVEVAEVMASTPSRGDGRRQ